MKATNFISFLLTLMLCFGLFAFASPPNISANTAVKADKSANTGTSVAVGSFDSSYAVAPILQASYPTKQTAPRVALPQSTKEITVRRFYGYSISRNLGKILLKPLNTQSIGRFEPDFVPLN